MIQWASDEQKPLNNQCPVCGTMAEPYYAMRGFYNYVASEGDPVMTSCKRCNALFVRFAENIKEKK